MSNEESLEARPFGSTFLNRSRPLRAVCSSFLTAHLLQFLLKGSFLALTCSNPDRAVRASLRKVSILPFEWPAPLSLRFVIAAPTDWAFIQVITITNRQDALLLPGQLGLTEPHTLRSWAPNFRMHRCKSTNCANLKP